MNQKMLLGLIGSLSIIIGVFSPSINLPLLGYKNYFEYHGPYGQYVLILATISLVITLIRKYYILLLGASLGCLGILIYTFHFIYTVKTEVINDMQNTTDDTGLLYLFSEYIGTSYGFQWGWILLFVGSVLLLVSAIISDDKNNKKIGVAHKTKSGLYKRDHDDFKI